jgi:ElaB/YqjD/DUF883 family membrane-anchored ribosome-binding protein
MKTQWNDTLRRELKTLIHNAEDLVHTTSDDLNESAKQARKRLATAIDSAKDTYGDLEKMATKSAKAADEAIHQYPYQTAGVCFAFGLLCGIVLARRS